MTDMKTRLERYVAEYNGALKRMRDDMRQFFRTGNGLYQQNARFEQKLTEMFATQICEVMNETGLYVAQNYETLELRVREAS